ncbi:MAG: DUF1844 domain-containing protein [Actinobacteria bacterium]|nr:DUF1844 domain-containing protein [Actinomycetota bacterium]MCG2818931.1 DUF1844 domain-containing protein [Actinomycetes bacterium]MBU4219491.1 DUF1844 domain-containing protein [Actinomycetota bacterium]MBU4359149.1 DUF1844 domain-containing protein [Actinomycetota bacterium]MBU4392700.1 DUF1844 domain-containing protein [Actinomycetota bacterium]
MGENDKQEEEKDEAKQTSSRLWTPYGDPGSQKREAADKPAAEAGGVSGAGGEAPADEVSDEELRKRIEEAMEKITVADVVLDMIVSLSSLAYQRMGIPKEVNEKYRDMEQAQLAIDSIDALLEVLGRSLPEDALKPLSGTLDNLKMNFARES